MPRYTIDREPHSDVVEVGITLEEWQQEHGYDPETRSYPASKETRGAVPGAHVGVRYAVPVVVLT